MSTLYNTLATLCFTAALLGVASVVSGQSLPPSEYDVLGPCNTACAAPVNDQCSGTCGAGGSCNCIMNVGGSCKCVD